MVPAHPRQPDIPAQIPAALASPSEDSAAVRGLNEEMDRLAEEFTGAVTASGLNPDSPEYAELWQAEQLSADQLLRLRYGDQVWLRQHIRARHEAAASGEE